MTSSVPPAPGQELMIEYLERLPTEFRSNPTLHFDERRVLADIEYRIKRAFWLDLQHMAVAGAAPEAWSQRLRRRLGLVPWVVWATIVAAIELLCLLMAARP